MQGSRDQNRAGEAAVREEQRRSAPHRVADQLRLLAGVEDVLEEPDQPGPTEEQGGEGSQQECRHQGQQRLPAALDPALEHGQSGRGRPHLDQPGYSDQGAARLGPISAGG